MNKHQQRSVVADTPAKQITTLLQDFPHSTLVMNEEWQQTCSSSFVFVLDVPASIKNDQTAWGEIKHIIAVISLSKTNVFSTRFLWAVVIELLSAIGSARGSKMT
jgi:hypothetical protein